MLRECGTGVTECWFEGDCEDLCEIAKCDRPVTRGDAAGEGDAVKVDMCRPQSQRLPSGCFEDSVDQSSALEDSACYDANEPSRIGKSGW